MSRQADREGTLTALVCEYYKYRAQPMDDQSVKACEPVSAASAASAVGNTKSGQCNCNIAVHVDQSSEVPQKSSDT